MRHAYLALFCTLLLSGAGACAPSNPGGDGNQIDAALPPQPDTDGDTISDLDEGRAAGTDTDSDGTPDYQDDDSDGDGVPDEREAGDGDTNTQPPDSDSDGLPDFRDTDSDANGRADAVDGTSDLDGDGRPDFADLDDDDDNLSDVVELGADPGAPADTDGDTIPDFRDVDSDNDSILDAHELMSDPDGDLLPAYRDTDADGDCRLDALEAGDDDLMTPPVDTDGDGGGDFLDVDSDNDGLLDQLEDTNCNGALDGGESSTSSTDTDGDGVDDLVEHAAGTDPGDPASNPQANGDFVFLVPYQMPPSPAQDTLDFATDISQADVQFLLDTTFSMSDEIAAIKSSLGTIAAQLGVEIPNIGIGVAGYEDFPTGAFGAGGDLPFYLLHRVSTIRTAAGLASVQAGVNQYTLGDGGDVPEAGWEALYQVANGAGLANIGNATVPAFNGASAPPGPNPLPMEQYGTLGGVGFRQGSLPIVVWITDARSHNSNITGDNYGLGGTVNSGTAIQALNARGAKIVGVVAQGGQFAQAKTDMTQGVTGTGGVVTPAAWPPVGMGRPAGCSIAQCCTGQNGAGQTPTAGNTCPLVFEVNSAGGGMGAQIVQAIKVLVSSVAIDIAAAAVDDPADAVDAIDAFVDRIQANPAGAAPCSSGLTVVDTNGDGVADTFSNVLPGARVCFDVIPKMNVTVVPTTMPQMFKATIVVTGDGVTTLDTRDVYFLVPPVIPDPPIN